MARLTGMLLAAALWLPQLAQGLTQGADTQQGMQAGSSAIAVGELPPEARDTLRAIKKGVPFPYPRDGAVFNNFEQILPKRQRGYYHEYTVTTPGVNNRGVRRIISGKPDEYYYTADHYQTFKRIVE